MEKFLHIDESGDLGSGGRFFVIAAVEFQNRKRIKNLVKRFRKSDMLPEIKGAELDSARRQQLIDKLNVKDDHFISYIILDKHNLNNKKLFEDKNILFNYLCSFLFKRHIKNSTDDLMLCFDNRTVKVRSGNSLRDYLRIQGFTKLNCKGSINACYLDSKADNCIQMVDAIANTIYQSYKYNRKGFYNQLKISQSIRFPQATFGS